MVQPVFDGGATSEVRVGELYASAQSHVVCVGASFYRTIKLHKKLILSQLSRKVRFEFCFLSQNADFNRIAPQFGQRGDQLRTEVEATWAETDELSAKFPGIFRAIGTATCPLARTYIVDPDAEKPSGIIVFYAASTDSVTLPAWSVENFREMPWKPYFEDALFKISEESKNDVFVIHGHDEAKWRELKDILNKIGATPQILGESSGSGSTSWLERFCKMADQCEYAIALFTADDWVTNKGKTYFQPRPNVLIELGYFISRISLSNILILTKGEITLPSDLQGLVSLRFHENVSELEGKLREELRNAGIIA